MWNTYVLSERLQSSSMHGMQSARFGFLFRKTTTTPTISIERMNHAGTHKRYFHIGMDAYSIGS